MFVIYFPITQLPTISKCKLNNINDLSKCHMSCVKTIEF